MKLFLFAYTMMYATYKVPISEGGKNTCPIVPLFPLPSPAKDELAFELKILLKVCLERPPGVWMDGKADKFVQYLLPICSNVNEIV